MHIYKILCTSFNRLINNVSFELVAGLLLSPFAEYATLYWCFDVVVVQLLLKILLFTFNLSCRFLHGVAICVSSLLFYWQVSRDLVQVFKAEGHVLHVQFVPYPFVYNAAFAGQVWLRLLVQIVEIIIF